MTTFTAGHKNQCFAEVKPCTLYLLYSICIATASSIYYSHFGNKFELAHNKKLKEKIVDGALHNKNFEDMG